MRIILRTTTEKGHQLLRKKERTPPPEKILAMPMAAQWPIVFRDDLAKFGAVQLTRLRGALGVPLK